MRFNNSKSNFASKNYRSRNYSGYWQKQFINEHVASIFKIGFDETQKLFSKAKEEHLPKNLYKFYPPSIYSLIGLQNNNVFLSSPRDFNDPFDSYICIESDSYIKHSLLKALKNRNLKSDINTQDSISIEEFNILEDSPVIGKYKPELGHDDSFDTVLHYICLDKSEPFRSKINCIMSEVSLGCKLKVELIRDIPFRVTCFSNFNNDEELGKNTVMWSHYAQEHKGFCVKYSTNFSNLPNREIIECGLFPVMYTSRIQKLMLQDLKNIKLSNKKFMTTSSILKKAYKALITKSKFWNYEKEWRLIISEENDVHLTNNTLPFLNVESIYMGCRIDDNIKVSLVKFAMSKGINIYQAKQSNETFQLDFFDIDLKSLEEDEYFSKLSICNNIEDKNTRNRKLIKLNSIFNLMT